MATVNSPPRVHEELGGARRAELREALERSLEAVDADDRVGPLIGATGLRMRFEFTDLDLVLNVAAGERRPQRRAGRSPTTRAGRRSWSCG